MHKKFFYAKISTNLICTYFFMSINSNNSSNQNIDLKKSIPVQYKDLNPFQLQIHFIESESLFPEEKQNKEGIVLDFIKSERQKLNQNMQQIVNDLQEYKNEFNSNKTELDSAFRFYLNSKISSLPNTSSLEKFYLENPDFINDFKLNPNFSKLINELYKITYYRFALSYLNQKKQKELIESDNEKIDKLTQDILLQDSDYSDFSLKHWHTDWWNTWWYQYSNNASIILKQNNKFEWWKHRIYFEIPFDKFEVLKEVLIQLSSEFKIPISFKYLDVFKSHPSDIAPDSKTTRFVANFSCENQAKFMHSLLLKDSSYETLASDRENNYNWESLDNIATYAQGYNEQRNAIKRLKEAVLNQDWTYSYFAEDWRKITISSEIYENIIKNNTF